MNKQEITDLIVERLVTNKEHLTKTFPSDNPHIKTKYFVLDDLLPAEFVMEIFKNFPQESQYFFRDTFRERKYSFAKLNELENPITDVVTDALQSLEVIREISEITQLSSLEGDPSLYAGGLSRMDQTHFLNPHIDNSHDGERERYRRLNLLFYVTPDIDEKDGGNFELWDDRVTTPFKIPSKFNRLVVMETTKSSWHSVDPVISDIQRCCLSNYYFSNESPTSNDYYHVTSFIGRPGQTFQRTYGRVDNFLRQFIASKLGISRGHNRLRHRD